MYLTCNVLQRAAARCSVSNLTRAPHRLSRQCVAACCGVLRCVAVFAEPDTRMTHEIVYYNVLQSVAVCYNVLRYFAACCSVMQCVSNLTRARISWRSSPSVNLKRLCCSLWQSVAVRSGVLQCVPIVYLQHLCCSVWQCVACAAVCCSNLQ